MADILVAGSTGFIGNALLQRLANNPAYPDVIALTRRPLELPPNARNLRPVSVDFDRLTDYQTEIAARTVVCALGTTMKKAGSRENFRNVDYQLPLALAHLSSQTHCRNWIVVSAVGANPASRFFYNQVKGQLERDLQQLALPSLHLLRPSLLLGRREAFRPAEEAAKRVAGFFGRFWPGPYRPIHRDDVVEKILSLLNDFTPGVHIYQGKSLKRTKAFTG